MSAFGRRNGPGGLNPGARPSFGVARPMKGGERAAPVQAAPKGGEQFPPLPGQAATPAPAAPSSGSSSNRNQDDAMSRRAERSNTSHDNSSDFGGFEASIHKIKEQVLPRLLERVDPEAAASLTKDELSEEFRPIIMEVLAELKVTLNRRERFAPEKVLIDELLGCGQLEELLDAPAIS